MAGTRITEQEWEVFLKVAERLGLDASAPPREGVRFTELEAAGHRLGRAVAQATTERLALMQAEGMTGPQPCPTCGRTCPLVHRQRPLETIDGPIELREPVCHCPACRRDFFPAASGLGAGSTEL
jgi:hypothetical protein